VRLLGQASGVDAENLYLGQIRGDDVGEHHGLGSQTVGVDDAPVRAHRRGKKLPNSRSLVL
jgi:hypothetical protein